MYCRDVMGSLGWLARPWQAKYQIASQCTLRVSLLLSLFTLEPASDRDIPAVECFQVANVAHMDTTVVCLRLVKRTSFQVHLWSLLRVLGVSMHQFDGARESKRPENHFQAFCPLRYLPSMYLHN